EEHRNNLGAVQRDGGGPTQVEIWAPSVADDDRFKRWWGQYLRLGASPAAARAVLEMTLEIDVRDILPAVHVPTLVLHRTGDRRIAVGGGRYLAERIPGARFIELPGIDHLAWVGDSDAILNEVEEFLTGTRHSAEPTRVLATVLFTDMVLVSSTVRDLVAGSGLSFTDRGTHELKGVPGTWRILRVEPPAT